MQRLALGTRLTVALVVAGAFFGLESCGSSTTSSTSPSSSTPSGSTNSTTTSAVTTSISDPPVCALPNGGFSHVWVTITRVRANISSDAGPDDSGWVDLVDLSNSPKQIDLLSLASTTCVLTELGSTTGLAPGNYQQIRLYLLANNATGVAVPSPNQCGNLGFNCVVLSNGTAVTLQLSSQSQTGIKIPAKQISSGGVNLTAGQSADINIDFNTCDSLVEEGNGQFRLKPVLHAGEVALNTNSLAGKVIDGASKNPIANAVVLVEQPDSTGVDRVVQSEMTASDGTFIFCPLPAGNYDLVVAASTPSPVVLPPIGVGQTYNATVTFHVPVGSSLAIPLVAEGGTDLSSAPAAIQGVVTTSAAGNQATQADIGISALQQAAPAGGSVVTFTVPTFAGSVSTLETASGSSCAAGADCANYTLFLPASNPSVGTFSSSGTAYAAPAAGNVAYTVDAQAFVPDGSSTPDCSASELTTSLNSGGGPLLALAGATVTAQTLAFGGCE